MKLQLKPRAMQSNPHDILIPSFSDENIIANLSKNLAFNNFSTSRIWNRQLWTCETNFTLSAIAISLRCELYAICTGMKWITANNLHVEWSCECGWFNFRQKTVIFIKISLQSLQLIASKLLLADYWREVYDPELSWRREVNFCHNYSEFSFVEEQKNPEKISF